MISAIVCLPPDHTAIIQWRNGTSYISPWIETPPISLKPIFGTGIFIANFTVPKTLYRLPDVVYKLTIRDNSSIVWEDQQRQLLIDELIPNIDLLFPEDQQWEGTVSLVWNISDSGIVYNYDIYLYNSSEQFLVVEGTTLTEYVVDTTVFSDWIYTLEIFVGDLNSTTYEISINNINDAPSVTILNPDSWGSYSEQLAIEWLMEDINEDTLTVSIFYSVDQVIWYPIIEAFYETSTIWDISTIADGRYYLQIVVSDGLLDTSKIISVTIYNPRPPTIQILSPLADAHLSDPIHISWEVFDPNPSDTLKFTVYYSNDNSTWVIISANIYTMNLTWNTTDIESGTYYILVTVTDASHSASAYMGPIYFESRSKKSSSFPGMSLTLFALGLLIILLKKKKSPR